MTDTIVVIAAGEMGAGIRRAPERTRCALLTSL